jgi:hypothetical protein
VPRLLFEERLSAETNGILSHTFGKIVMRPKKRIMPPETHFQKDSGTAMKSVLTLRRNVKRSTETPREAVTMNARLLCVSSGFPESDPPTMIGSSGNTHGARTVRIPATKETRISGMIILRNMKITFNTTQVYPH